MSLEECVIQKPQTSVERIPNEIFGCVKDDAFSDLRASFLFVISLVTTPTTAV